MRGLQARAARRIRKDAVITWVEVGELGRADVRLGQCNNNYVVLGEVINVRMQFIYGDDLVPAGPWKCRTNW